MLCEGDRSGRSSFFCGLFAGQIRGIWPDPAPQIIGHGGRMRRGLSCDLSVPCCVVPCCLSVLHGNSPGFCHDTARDDTVHAATIVAEKKWHCIWVLVSNRYCMFLASFKISTRKAPYLSRCDLLANNLVSPNSLPGLS